MLNRIYIVVGVFAILVLTGAFLAPRFIQWSDYRDRMEALASGVLGAEVTIRGDISFSLLPSPRLEFSDVIVGDAESPSASVAQVEAEFALFDFLRDNYNVTALTLMQPVVDLVLDENGLFSSGVDLTGAGSGVALGHARISNGSIRLTDLRADEVFTASRIDGDLRLSSFVGPFQFQGGADYDGQRYEIRFNSGTSDAQGATRISAFAREFGGAYSVNAEGMLTAGMAPRYDGRLVYRQAPPASDTADNIRGDLVLESNMTVSTDRVVLSGYTLHPDENRAGMRLTGSASIRLGAERSFDAVVSGGVFSLPPRPATEAPAELPYEFVRLLSEIPAPPLPPMPGTLDVDLAEVGLRGFALRDLRLDATSDGTGWRIEQALANMPGDSEVRFSGTVSNEGGHAAFQGDFSLVAQRLDALAQLWKRPSEDNPLFNTPGTLDGRLMLAGDAFGLSNGRFSFAGQTHSAELRLGFGSEPRLDMVLHLGRLNAAQTEALLALAPDVTNGGSFGASFPDGSFSLTAQTLELFGLPATDLRVEGQWAPDDLRFSRLNAKDWGGVDFSTALRLAGSLSEPRISGSGRLKVASAEAPGLAVLYETAGVPFTWQQGLAASWPADLQFILSDDAVGAGQVLTLGGALGAAELDLRAEMERGLAGLAEEDLRLVVSLEAEDGLAAQEQFGLGNTALFAGDAPLIASLFLEGNGPGGFDGRAALSQGTQSISYFGGLAIAENGEVSGEGTLDVLLNDDSGLAALVGARGAGLPGVEGSGAFSFTGRRQAALRDIAGIAGNVAFNGAISLEMLGQMPSYSGSLRADGVDAAGLAMALFGKAALTVPGDGFWPEGPLALDVEPRPSRGEIAVTADAMTAYGTEIAEETSFTYSWQPDSASLDQVRVRLGDGRLEMNIVACCAGPLSERRLTGRVSLEGVDVSRLLPPTSALGGKVSGGVQFEGSGQSLAEVMRRMTGEGNFAIADFVAPGLSPSVFPTLAGIDDPLNIEADALETLTGLALGQGAFTADEARGAFTIAAGTARLANLIVAGEGGQLAGSLNLMLNQLGLAGSFVLTPRDFTDPTGLIQSDSARIIARIAGSVLAPAVTLDFSEIVAAVQVRANELEVERLEELRLADEARQRAAAEERNRLVEEQLRQAREEAARRAAEEEARRLEEERLLQEQQMPPEETPLDFSFPGVNQPMNSSVNRPIQLIPPN